MTAAVMGAGNWGTAFAQVLCDAGTPTVLWCRRSQVAETINTTRCNQEYLPGFTLPGSLRATADAADALSGADLVVLVVPSRTLRENLAGWLTLIPADAVLVSLMKGIELETGKRMSEVIAEVAHAPQERIVVVSP